MEEEANGGRGGREEKNTSIQSRNSPIQEKRPLKNLFEMGQQFRKNIRFTMEVPAWDRNSVSCLELETELGANVNEFP